MQPPKVKSRWFCPRCHRPFKHRNQAHSCVRIEAATHLENKNPVVTLIYEKLAKAVGTFGDVKISSTKSSIMFVSKSTFLALKPKQNWIDIEFLLREEVNKYPIHKTFRANKSRIAHFVRLQSPKDVSASLIGLLRRSYKITSEA